MLEIPTYLIWDSDKSKNKDGNPNANRRLLRLLGQEEEDFPSKVMPTFACFEDKLEATLKSELGPEVVETTIREIVEEFGDPAAEDCLKRPALFSSLLSKAKAKGHESRSLNLILDNILALSPAAKLARADGGQRASQNRI